LNPFRLSKEEANKDRILWVGFCFRRKGSVLWAIRKRMIPFQRERKRVRNSMDKMGKEKIKLIFWMFGMCGGLGVEAIIRKLYF